MQYAHKVQHILHQNTVSLIVNQFSFQKFNIRLDVYMYVTFIFSFPFYFD